MGDLTPELIERARRAKQRQNSRKRASIGPALGTGLSYLDRATRLAGLGIGTAYAANPFMSFAHFVPGVKDWLPDVERLPEAMRAFNRMRQQGDWDAAIGAYHDVLNAGPGFWGTSEVASSFIPTGGPFVAGGKLIGAAPGLARTISKVAPQVIRPGVATGIRGGVTGLGKGMRAPWQVEEAVGRGAMKGLGFVGRSALHPRTGPMAQAISRMRPGRGIDEGLAGTEPPLVDLRDYFGDAGLGELTEFPEPWNILDVFKGPPPGRHNLKRIQAQTDVMERMRPDQVTVPDDPRIQAGYARMARPVATGYEALSKRLDLEVDMKRLMPEVAVAAKKWLKMLPAKYLDDLGSSYTKKTIRSSQLERLGTGYTGEAAGEYHQGKTFIDTLGDARRTPAIINISLKAVNKQHVEAGQTIIHEVSHHLDDFIPEGDVRKLFGQWQKEMFTDGMGVMEELSRIRQLRGIGTLTEVQRDAVLRAYRYEGGFREWVAEVITDKALRDIYMEIPSYRGVIEKILAQIKVIAKAVREFIGGDEAGRVYRKLVNGDYSGAERGAMRNERLRIEAEAYLNIVKGTVQMREVKSLENLIERGRRMAEFGASRAQLDAADFPVPPTAAARGPVVPVTGARGRSYEQAQQAIDDYETTLMGRYSEEEVLQAPIYGPADRTAGEDYLRRMADLRGRTPLTNQELQELSELYKARDAIGEIEDVADLQSAMARLKPSTLKGPASLEDISDVVKTVSESTRRTSILHPGASGEVEDLVGEIYNGLAWKQYNRANIATQKRLVNELSIDEVGANHPLASQARAIVEDIIGPTTTTAPTPAVPGAPMRLALEAAEGAGGVPGGPTGRGLPELEEMPTGFTFVAPLRELKRVIDEVVTSENPLIRQATRWVAPSVGRFRAVQKAITAYARQNISIDELSNVAIMAALDTHAQRWAGRIRHILPIDSKGNFGQTGKLWNDVFSNPNNPAYNLTTEQKKYIDDYIKVLDEIEEMRVNAGLEPLARTLKEGWFYIPRQVKGIRGLELTRPTNPKYIRFYEEATEGAARGVHYLNDPRETLLMHVRSAYKEVLQKQLDDVLEPLSINIAGFDVMIPKLVVARWQRASVKYQAANEAVKNKLFSGAGKARIETLDAAYQAALQKRRALSFEAGSEALKRTPAAQLFRERARGQLDRQVNKAKEALRTATDTEHGKLVTKRQKAQDALKARREEYIVQRKVARDAKIVKGSLFGPNQPDNISFIQWRRGAHRFFPEEDYKALLAGIGGGDVRMPDAPNVFWHGFQVLGNTIRFLASVGDFAMPLIHGLPLLARNPEAWGRMALRHHQAFFDPTVQARLIKDNLAEYQWLSQYGVPIGDPEFFAALAPGQGISLDKVASLLGKIGGREYTDSARNLLRLGGKQTFGRFQAAYNVGLGYSRIQLLKGLRSTWKGTDAELAQYIRNMTGGLDSRALGVGPTQRSIEGMFLAFSPRLLRSTVALVADATSVLTAKATGKATTAQGREALRTLAQLVGGVMGIYTLSGLALGKSWEEIGEGLNPLSGRRFLSHNINGDWIGIGGQIRSLTQFMASMYATLAPEEFPGEKAPLSGLTSASQYENPFIRFYMSRGAPGISMAAGTIEAFTGLDALPFDQVDGHIDLVKHLGTSALPFASQLHLEGGEFWRRPSLTVAGEMGGLRGGVDLRDRKSQEIFGEEYRHVQPFMQRMIREIVPEDVSQFDRIEQDRRQKLLELLEDVRSGRIKDSFAIWQEVQKINTAAGGARGEAGRDIDFEPADVDAEDPGIRALNQQNALFDDPEVVSEAGRLKYITYRGKMVSVLSVKIARLEIAWTPDQKDFVLRNTNTRPIPMELVASLPKPQKRSIGLSQVAREKYFTDQGRYDLARLSRRLFSLEAEGE
jgi:hypothetical protein